MKTNLERLDKFLFKAIVKHKPKVSVVQALVKSSFASPQHLIVSGTIHLHTDATAVLCSLNCVLWHLLLFPA